MNMANSLNELLYLPNEVDALFAKVLTKNDDSGRHGVLIPKEAHIMFPEFPNFREGEAVNHTLKLQYLLDRSGDAEWREGSWKHYHRYPERRMTALGCRKLDQAPEGALFVVARHRADLFSKQKYEIHVLYPSDSRYGAVLSFLLPAGGASLPGLSALDLAWQGDAALPKEGLEKLLEHFDRIHALGFVKTMRPGDTGIGYTFEELMGIEENNDRTADFEGIELKTRRLSRKRSSEGATKVNLFLREPTWTDTLKAKDRILEYGYIDPTGRRALYTMVQKSENTHGFSFSVDESAARLLLMRSGSPVGFWSYQDLETRLREKLHETAFVDAKTRKSGAHEEFKYLRLTYCTNPSVEALLDLIARNEVMLEVRMHVNERGNPRNHGSAFRIKERSIPSLYASVTQLRDNK